MAHTRRRERVRFDQRSEAFLGIASDYREALRGAEKLWRRLQRADVLCDPVKEEKARRELALVEDRLDAARQALLEHTRAIATDPMRTRVKRLGLGDSKSSVA